MKSKIVMSMAIIIFMAACKNYEGEKSNVVVENAKLNSLEKLVTGNQRFLDEKSIHPHQNKNAVLENQNGQEPFAVIITCSDSRVSPEIIFDQGIGDLFVIRNAGNLVSDIDMGSIEYAVEHLDTKLIVVLGHTECGAIKAYINDEYDSYKKHLSHIDDIVEVIAKENEEIEANKVTPKVANYLGAINANIKHSTKIIEDNKIIKQYKVQIVAMQYDIHTGKIIRL